MLNEKIRNDLKEGIEVPKTDGTTRKITKIINNRIYMQTGVKNEKYTTSEMIEFASLIISSGGTFTSSDLKKRFPREYNQGSCVFSMTGGILVFFGKAKCVKKGNHFEYVQDD